MFKLSFALLVAVVCGAPAALQPVHELSEDRVPCPSANGGTCSGNGQCHQGGDTSRPKCDSMIDLGGDTNVCECACDKGWKGWDCFTVDTCTDDMEVSMDFEGVYYDFYKANMHKQVKFKLTETDSCDMPGAPSDVPTFTAGTKDGFIYQTFKVEGKTTSDNAVAPWSVYGACGVLKRKVGSVQDGDVSVSFYNRKAGKAFSGDIEAHRMKVDGTKCKVFSWRIKHNSWKKNGWVWKDQAQAVWETTGKPETF
jgi:hypothetical protein